MLQVRLKMRTMQGIERGSGNVFDEWLLMAEGLFTSAAFDR